MKSFLLMSYITRKELNIKESSKEVSMSKSSSFELWRYEVLW